MFSIVTGLIIDSFNDLRAAKDEENEKLESACYICGIPQADFKEATSQGTTDVNFPTHVGQEHNAADYYALFVRLCETNPDDLSAQVCVLFVHQPRIAP